jgi:tungstate transport system ATP-binding protein
MSQNVYRLKNVSKQYDGRQILQVDHLEIYPGETFALVGPSGAGKSTLLRLLNFLERPTQGNIHFNGAMFGPERDVPIEIKRKVTTVFQRPLLLNRSVWSNVNFGLSLRSMRNSTERTRSALKRVGLLDLAKQRARTLSGGEAQRVALARAMVLKPQVLLLDEPTANLDPYNVGMIEDIVSSLNREEGTTLVLVTHNIFQARRLAQRVAFMLDGRLVEVADVETFFEHPQDPRTAAFVRGEMVY